VASSISAHFSRKHRNSVVADLRRDIVADESAVSSEAELHAEDGDGGSMHYDDMHTSSTWSSGEPDVPDNVLVERELLRLFVKMNTLLHVPRYAIQEIILGINHVHELSRATLAQSVKGICIQHSIPETLSAVLVDCIFKELPFFQLTDPTSKPAGPLSSTKLRDSHYRSHATKCEIFFAYNRLS